MRLIKLVCFAILLTFVYAPLSTEAAITKPRVKPIISRVTDVVVSVSSSSHDDKFFKVSFTGKITANGPATVQYRWIRNDGETSTGQLVFEAAGAKVVGKSWSVRKTRGGGTLSAVVEVQSPNQMTSNKASIDVPSMN